MGYNATIQCVALSSLDGITIKWTNSNGNSINNNQDSAMYSCNNSILFISNVTPSLHNTVYTCSAVLDANPNSCVTGNKTFTINVKGI